MFPNDDSENVEYNITIEIAQALTSLRDLNSKISSVPEILQNVQTEIQKMADKTGISFAAMETKFKSVALEAEKFKRSVEIGGTPIGGVENINFDNPLLDALKGAGQPFGDLGGAAGYKALNDARRESAVISNEERRSEAATAAEINKQKSIEDQLLATKQKKLDLANQELKAVEQEGAALQKQLSLYGQVSRTTSETMSYLRSFTKTQQGEGILSSFFGSYQAVQTKTGQIETLKNSIFELSKATGASFTQSGTIFKEQFSQIPGIVGQVNQAVGQLDKGFKQTAESSKKLSSGINILNTAMHILVASAIFAVINAFQQLFTMAIKGLRELETATYNLVNAERTLSEQGVEITPKGLDETIKKLQQIDPLLSRIQATELVSRTAALVAPQVGFDAKEIEQLSQAIAVLAVRNRGLGKSFEEVESQVSNAFLSGRVSVGINQLGVKITDQIVKDEALRLGLVKTGDEFDKLTGKMESNIKARAMLSVLSQNTDKEIGHLPDYLKSADATFGIFQARLQDFLTILGKDFGPLLIEIFRAAIRGLEVMIMALEKFGPQIKTFVAQMAGAFRALDGLSRGDISVFKNYSEGVKDALGSFEEFANAADTATSSSRSFANSINTVSKASDEAKEKVAALAKEMQDKLADIERQYGDKRQDIARDYSDKIADINRKARDKDADALDDYNNKIADINRDSAEKQAEAQQDYRQKEIDREQEYQNKLKELRQKFLFDLEDALRERDARAVLRLLRQYQMDKKSLEDKNKQERQQNKAELQQKLQDAEIERQQKLEAARREYEENLKELALSKQRELEEAALWKRRELRDAATWHRRQLEEQRIYLQRKLRDLADAIAKEYQLTDAGARNLLNLMQSYYSASGALVGSTMTNPLSGGVSAPSNPSPVYPNQQPGIGSGLFNPYDIRSRGGGFAEGGTLLATRPTTVTFGETPEIATFTPITRTGQNLNDLVVSSGQGQGAGKANVVLTLSPDLRAEIVENSLETMAIHVERLVRND